MQGARPDVGKGNLESELCGGGFRRQAGWCGRHGGGDHTVGFSSLRMIRRVALAARRQPGGLRRRGGTDRARRLLLSDRLALLRRSLPAAARPSWPSRRGGRLDDRGAAPLLRAHASARHPVRHAGGAARSPAPRTTRRGRDQQFRLHLHATTIRWRARAIGSSWSASSAGRWRAWFCEVGRRTAGGGARQARRRFGVATSCRSASATRATSSRSSC